MVAVHHAAHAAHAAPAAKAFNPENTPLNLGPATSVVHSTSAGGGLVRTVVGLAIVIAVIYGLTWILKQVKANNEDKAAGTGLASLATLPLGPNRSVHLIRSGREYVLVGSAENGVTPLRRYTEEQARTLGLLDSDSDSDSDIGESDRGGKPGGSGAAIGRFLRGEDGDERNTTQRALDAVRNWTVRA